jgi:hypothetical protein
MNLAGRDEESSQGVAISHRHQARRLAGAHAAQGAGHDRRAAARGRHRGRVPEHPERDVDFDARVACLYVDPRGPYPALVGPEMCWDEARDARMYVGPFPVVAHPPCGPWSRFAVLGNCRQDALCASRALEQVRTFGGVLEHPSESRFFDKASLPHPGEFPDYVGGETFEVDQVSWGHACSKRTWLYVVGLPRIVVLRSIVFGGQPTHVLSRDRRAPWRDPLPEASHEIRRRTPPAFARWLVELVAQVRRT